MSEQQELVVEMSRRSRAAVRHFATHAFPSAEAWAAKAGIPSATGLHAFLREKTQWLAMPTLVALHAALQRLVPDASIAMLLGEAPLLAPTGRPLEVAELPVRFAARAGAYTGTVTHFAERRLLAFPGLKPGQADIVVHVEDGHADRLYPKGSYLAVRCCLPNHRARPGEHLIVGRRREREQGTGIEITVREVVQADGRPGLVFCSSNPRLEAQRPLRPNAPGVELRGVVVASCRFEDAAG